MELWRVLDAHSRGVESQMEPWRVCRPVVADLHHLDEEQVPDPDPHPYQLIAEKKREEKGQ